MLVSASRFANSATLGSIEGKFSISWSSSISISTGTCSAEELFCLLKDMDLPNDLTALSRYGFFFVELAMLASAVTCKVFSLDSGFTCGSRSNKSFSLSLFSELLDDSSLNTPSPFQKMLLSVSATALASSPSSNTSSLFFASAASSAKFFFNIVMFIRSFTVNGFT
ncbi:hypothetical protein ACHAWT_002028 [Skeletonema menzelii]